MLLLLVMGVLQGAVALIGVWKNGPICNLCVMYIKRTVSEGEKEVSADTVLIDFNNIGLSFYEAGSLMERC